MNKLKMPIEEAVQNGKSKTMVELKKSAFDLIAVAIGAALVLASLDVFNLVDLGKMTIGEFVMSWVPYFLATTLLTMDMYKKGVFVGKSTAKFESVVESYSSLVNGLSGEQIKELGPFCERYNEEALINLRTAILKEEGITYEEFDSEFTVDDVKYDALKTWTRKELIAKNYTKAQIKAIRLAKRSKVRGINVNILLSSINISDPTNIGDGESELGKRAMTFSVIRQVTSTMLMSLIVIKDITTWGWASLIGILFKVIYMFARSFMNYFNGYDDITVSVANHITRKTDILKMYLNYVPEETVSEEIEPQGNN